jgi:hypothetical protein
MSYGEFSQGELWVTHCNDVACAGNDETKSLVAHDVNVGSFSSIAIAADGFPVISYYDVADHALKFVTATIRLVLRW